jgi:pilus assembly protein CpaC
MELPSGGAMVMGGLLEDDVRQSLSGLPGLKKLPVLGTLFRSRDYQRAETELVIIVTPYLVKPVSTQLATPADGYRAPTDVQMNVEGQTFTGRSGPASVVPSAAPAISGGAAAATPGFKL